MNRWILGTFRHECIEYCQNEGIKTWSADNWFTESRFEACSLWTPVCNRIELWVYLILLFHDLEDRFIAKPCSMWPHVLRNYYLLLSSKIRLCFNIYHLRRDKYNKVYEWVDYSYLISLFRPLHLRLIHPIVLCSHWSLLSLRYIHTCTFFFNIETSALFVELNS